MLTHTVTLREASKADLVAINQVIDAAIMTWKLPERVKRLSLPSYHYKEHDLQHIKLIVAEDDKQNIIGVAAWEQADPNDAPLIIVLYYCMVFTYILKNTIKVLANSYYMQQNKQLLNRTTTDY